MLLSSSVHALLLFTCFFAIFAFTVSECLYLHLLWSTALLFLTTPRYHGKCLSQPLLSSPLLTLALISPFLSSQKLEGLYALYGTPKVSERSKQAAILRLLFLHATHFLMTFPKSSSLPPASKAPVSCQHGLGII